MIVDFWRKLPINRQNFLSFAIGKLCKKEYNMKKRRGIVEYKLHKKGQAAYSRNY